MSQVLLLLTALSLSASIQPIRNTDYLVQVRWELRGSKNVDCPGFPEDWVGKHCRRLWSQAMSYGKIMKTLLEQWQMYKDECLRNISSEPLASDVVCNRTFDRYACWPDALPNTTISVSCPWYLPWHHKVQHGFVYRECDSEGRWISLKNASECQLDDSEQLYGRTLSRFLAMYTVGYSLSLGALVLALGILVTFRKLHCTRNNIHMNLFTSFILKGILILLKDVLIDTATPHIIPDDIHSDSQVERLVGGKMAVACRVAFVMMHYSIIANNYWLLVEGIYLYNLLVVTVFTERNYFNIYLCIGWGAPLIFILPWATAKYLYENEECWQRNDSMAYWWIIRSPILLAILINFFIFVQIIKILMSKLRAHQMRYTDYKFRLAKSTLTLIPLLGIHWILSAFVMEEQVTNGPLRLAKLFYDLFFDSFQGLLVAILYCFVNKEVQSEMMKKWKRWKLGKNIEEEYRHTHSQLAHMKGSVVGHPPCPPKPPDPSNPTGGQEENRQLVGGHPNGMGKTPTCLPFPLSSQDGSSHSTLIESINLEDRVQCYVPHHNSVESNF